MKEDAASPKLIGSWKQDHWILDKKNKQLTRVHLTPRQALFTPTGAKECPTGPDDISRCLTHAETENQTSLDSWRLTSQANKPMVNLWKGKTDNSLKDEEVGADLQQTGSSTRRAG